MLELNGRDSGRFLITPHLWLACSIIVAEIRKSYMSRGACPGRLRYKCGNPLLQLFPQMQEDLQANPLQLRGNAHFQLADLNHQIIY